VSNTVSRFKVWHYELLECFLPGLQCGIMSMHVRVWNNEPLYSLQVTLISPFIFIWRLPGSGLSTAFCTLYLLYNMYNTLNRLSVTEQFLLWDS